MREIHSPTGLHYQVHETPEDLAALTTVVSQQHSVWLDTELADWNTRTPRLSLIQIRLEDGSIHVVDVLSPEMAAAYEATFVPAVIEAPHVHKWAHYARFERRVFGPDRTQSLHCTFELARGVPYHRLPLRSLRLAALVRHLHGTSIDKSFQRADWGSSARTWRARRRSRAGACATSPWSYTGNQTESPEEAGAIAALVQSLVEGEAWWTDRDWQAPAGRPR